MRPAGLVERLARRYPGPCWLTGGDAALLQPHLSIACERRPNLVLEGLAAYAGSESDAAPPRAGQPL
jgi:hypothetical protein